MRLKMLLKEGSIKKRLKSITEDKDWDLEKALNNPVWAREYLMKRRGSLKEGLAYIDYLK